MKISAKFEGGKDLEKALLQLKTATAKGATRRAGKKALEPVRDLAIRLAPVGDRDDVHLKDHISISTKALKARKRNQVEIYMGVHKQFSSVGVNQEFGNIIHGPQSFMRPAWDTKGMAIIPELRGELWVEVKKSTERAARKAARDAARMK